MTDIESKLLLAGSWWQMSKLTCSLDQQSAPGKTTAKSVKLITIENDLHKLSEIITSFRKDKGGA